MHTHLDRFFAVIDSVGHSDYIHTYALGATDVHRVSCSCSCQNWECIDLHSSGKANLKISNRKLFSHTHTHTHTCRQLTTCTQATCGNFVIQPPWRDGGREPRITFSVGLWTPCDACASLTTHDHTITPVTDTDVSCSCVGKTVSPLPHRYILSPMLKFIKTHTKPDRDQTR